MVLALGMFTGLAMALAGIRPRPLQLSEGAVARVDEVEIARADLVRRLDALASDARVLPDDEKLNLVLERAIDEELLVAHGLALGLPRSDRVVRSTLIQAVLELLGSAASGIPDSAALDAHFAANPERFRRAGRLHLRRIIFQNQSDRSAGPNADAPDDHNAEGRAEAAWSALEAGAPWESVAQTGDAAPLRLPDGPLPPFKLREYLGPTALAAAISLEPGHWSRPVPAPEGRAILLLVARSEPTHGALDELGDLVVADLIRERREAAVRQFLLAARDQREIVRAEDD